VLKITVLAIHGDRVSLGFEGDSEIMVNRLEVWERRLAASPTLPPVTPKE
jgi:sRNA-binding carbon storage regulator CsrA